MADLLRDVLVDGAGSGALLSGPSTVFIENNSVFAGARVDLEMATGDVAGEYSRIGHVFTGAGSIAVDVQGAYYLRAVVSNANTSTAGGSVKTSVSCEVIQ